MYSVHLLQSEIRIVTIVRILYAEVAPSQLHMAVDNCIKEKVGSRRCPFKMCPVKIPGGIAVLPGLSCFQSEIYSM